MWTTDFESTMLRAESDGAFANVTPTGGARGGLTAGPDGNVWY